MSAERRLREYTAPGEREAAERARAVASAAFATRTPGRRPSRAPRWALAAAAVLAVAAATTAPGSAVAEWVRDLVRTDPPTPGRAPALSALPAPGRLLVTGPGGAWVVRASGSSRRLGSYDEATWSPRGLFVAATRGHSLSAVQPDGTVRWTLARARVVAQPAWAPSGYRIAYRAGRSIRVVAGDGSGDRLLARSAGAAAPAWKPGTPRHELAYANRRGAIVLRDADTGRTRWRSPRGGAPASLAWAAGGRRLAVLRGRSLVLLDGTGRVWSRRALPGRGVALAAHPRRPELAVAVAGGDGTGRLLLVRLRAAPRTLLAAPGAIGEAAFSPDGTTVLVSRPGAGEWVFLPVARGRARAVSGIGRHFDPGSRSAPRMPAVAGWAR